VNDSIEVGVRFLKENDPILKKIIEINGKCTLSPSSTYFKNLIRSIISQQLSVKAAKTIHDRLIAKCQDITPENTKNLSIEELRSLGISYQKASFIHSLADYTLMNPDHFTNSNDLSDEQIIKNLCNIKGIGLWTAQMFLIFSLNRLNILPLSDAGFRRSFKQKYSIYDNDDLDSEIVRISEAWGNYKSIAVWYLWKDLDSK
jgi:DNA-3-methyladenine glycosylase II